MTTAQRKEQIRRAAAKVRKNRREAGLKPHEVWALPAEWEERIKPLLDELEATRKP